jgi:hypothetical protein
MNLYHASRVAVVTLISLLPVGAHSAETGRNHAKSENPVVSADDLAAASERIRQTGAQMQTDLRVARARLEAKKAQQEAERKREAELARQRAAEQAAIKEAKRQQALEDAQAQARKEAALKAAQAERERQIALAMKRVKDEQAAREKAAIALKEARKSAGVKAFADESTKEGAKEGAKERAARALREARMSAGPKAMAESGL